LPTPSRSSPSTSVAVDGLDVAFVLVVVGVIEPDAVQIKDVPSDCTQRSSPVPM
jgi:hypothetical protein